MLREVRTVSASHTRPKQPVDALSYAAIVVQLVGLVAFAGALLFTATRVILPFGLEQLTLQLGDESARALLKSLTPVFWFALGYLFVAALRSRVRCGRDALSHSVVITHKRD